VIVYIMRSFLNSLADPDDCTPYETFNTITVDRNNEDAVK